MNQKIEEFIESSGYKNYAEYDMPEIWHYGEDLSILLERAAKTVKNLSKRKLSEIKGIKLNKHIDGKYNLVVEFEGEHNPELCYECISKKDEIERLSSNMKVHISHCCAKHGCKYWQEDCPVETGKYHQEFPCEDCYE